MGADSEKGSKDSAGIADGKKAEIQKGWNHPITRQIEQAESDPLYPFSPAPADFVRPGRCLPAAFRPDLSPYRKRQKRARRAARLIRHGDTETRFLANAASMRLPGSRGRNSERPRRGPVQPRCPFLTRMPSSNFNVRFQRRGPALASRPGFRADVRFQGRGPASALVLNQVHKFFARLGLLEKAGEIGSRGKRVLFFHAAHLHAHMLRFDHHHDAQRV